MKRDTSLESWRQSTIKACRTANEKLAAYKESLISNRDKNILILKQVEERKLK